MTKKYREVLYVVISAVLQQLSIQKAEVDVLGELGPELEEIHRRANPKAVCIKQCLNSEDHPEKCWSQHSKKAISCGETGR